MTLNYARALQKYCKFLTGKSPVNSRTTHWFIWPFSAGKSAATARPLEAPPNHPLLQELYDLDRSLPGFDDHLSNVLYREEYKRCETDLEGDSLRWLVDYLDRVRPHVVQFGPRSSQRRLLMISPLSAPLSQTACVRSQVYAEPERSSLCHTYLYPA